MKTTISQSNIRQLIRSRKLKQARRIAMQALGRARAKKDVLEEIRVLSHLGRICRINADYRLLREDRIFAEKYLTEAIVLCREKGYIKGLIPVLLTYGRLNFDQKKFDAALKLYQQALQLSEKENYLDGQNKALSAISQLFVEKNDFTQALFYAQRSGQILEVDDDSELWLNYYMRMGFVFARRHQYAEILDYFESALKLSTELGDIENEVLALQNIAVAYASRSAYKEAFQYFLISLEKGEAINFKLSNVKCLVNVGTIFSLLNNYKEAENRYLRVLEDYAEVMDENTRIVVHYNIGDLHFHQKNWKKAEHYLALCLEMAERANYKEVIAQVLTQIGRLHCEQGDYPKALDYGERAKILFEALGEIHGRQINLVNLGLAHFRQSDDLVKAQAYAAQGLALAKGMSDKEVFADAYQLLADIYRNKNDFKRAYHYQVSLSQIKEQLYSDRLDRQLVDLELQAEIRDYREQLQRLQKGESAYQEKIAQLKMQALQAQMNPHFIFNSMNAIQYFLALNDHESAMIFLSRFARLIRFIFEYSQRTSISLQEELEFLRLYLDLEGLRFQDKVVVHLEVAPELDLERIQIPALLVQPLVENAFKHGLLHKTEGGLLYICFKKQGKFLRCTIEDNGVGRKEAQALNDWKPTASTSSSLEITRNRLELLNQRGDFAPNFSPFKVVDLLDKEGVAAGTSVIFHLKIE